jgi:single-strand DNA-binding protein
MGGTELATELVTELATEPVVESVGEPADVGPDPAAEPAAEAGANEVTLRGRVSSAPEPRELPSGTCIVTLRVSVPRAPSPMTKGSKQTSDWVDCVAWGARQRRSVATWRVGDVVEVEGAFRRRFYRAGGGTAMRLEVEVLAGRVVRRADRRPGTAS